MWTGPDLTLPPSIDSIQMDIITSNLTINVTNGSNEGQFYNCSFNYVRCPMTVTSSAMFSIIPEPIITIAPIDIITENGSNVTLTCQTTNTGITSITWTGPVTNVQSNDESTVTLINSSLPLLNVDFNFGGQYTCTATNEAGSVSVSAIVFLIPVVIPEIILTANGSVITLSCLVQSFPNITIGWERENDMGTFVTVPGQFEKNYTLSPVMYGDEGAYRCVANSVEFNAQISLPSAVTGENAYSHRSVLYSILYLYCFSVFPRAIINNDVINMTYQFGQTAIIECNSTGGPGNTYLWQKDGNFLIGENSTTLTLTNVEASIGGAYTCVVSNAAGVHSAGTHLFVYPYFVEQPMKNVLTFAGSLINLTCIAAAFPDPEYQWGHEDGRVRNLTNTSVLVISSVQFGDEGTYHCNATSNENVITSQNALVTGKCHPLKLCY